MVAGVKKRLSERLGIVLPPELAAPLPDRMHISHPQCLHRGAMRRFRSPEADKKAGETLRLYHAKRRAAKAHSATIHNAAKTTATSAIASSR